MVKKIVVIGSSAASIGFITKLRSFDQTSQIVCLTGDSHIPYNRCLLTDFLQRDATFDNIRLKPESFFTDHNVDLRLNSWVTEINRERKFVVCNNQEELYDILFVGTGTSPFIPRIPGVDLPGVFAYHSFDDVDRIDDFIQDRMPKSVVVIGAGINGIEATGALVARGLQVSVIDIADCVMPQQVDKKVAHFIEQLMKDAKVTLFKGQKVIALEQKNKESVGRVQFASGAFLLTDCVVFATGSRVNGDLVANAGLAMQEGSLQVDTAMKTNDKYIYAGGDICITHDIVWKKSIKSSTWSDAMLQGLIAASQLSDTPRAYQGVVGMRDSEFFGLPFYACGQTVDVEEFSMVQIHKKEYQHTFYLFDGILQGFVLIGNTEKMSTYRTWYLTKHLVTESDFMQ